MHFGSAFILMGSFFGATPSIVTAPVTLPAVAGSTFSPPPAAGVAAGVDVLEDPPPPHAAIDAASATARIPTHTSRTRIEHSCLESLQMYTELLILPCFVHLALHPVGNPMRIPPFNRRHHPAADEHREVQVIAAGKTGHAAASDRLPARHLVADFDVERREVPVQRLHSHPVIDDDAVAVNAEPVGVQHGSGIRRDDGHAAGHREIEAEMYL